MRKAIQNTILMFAVLLGFAAEGYTQADDIRAMAPEPGPARKIEIGKSESFKLDNGLTVIVVENHKVPRISYQLYVDRDHIVEADKAGYVSAAGDLLSTGTATRTKAEIDEAVDFVGGSVSTNSRGGFASSLTKHTDVVLEIFADVLLHPSFPQEEFDKWKTQTISGLQANKEDPNAIAGNVTSALVYGLDHPYGEMMTENTVESMSLEDCKEYYALYFKPNISYMVVVGDITAKHARQKIEKHFGNWASGEVPMHKYEMPGQADQVEVDFVDKTGAVQSVINITHAVDLKPGTPDVIPSRVMNTILGSGFSGRLFRNLREDKGYTYGAYSSLGSDELVARFGASASVRNEVTDSAVTEFLYELNQMRDTDVTDEELELAKNYIAGSFARNLESPQTVANFALSTMRYNLPEDYYATYLEKLDAVDVAAVRAMAQKYINPDKARIIVVGSKDDVAESLEQFAPDGEVKFYDIYGKEKAPEEDAGDVSGDEVISAYLEAVGGKSTLEGLKSTKQELSAEAMGATLDMVEYKMYPNKVSLNLSMAGQSVMRQVFNGETGYIEQMGQKMDIEGEMVDEVKNQAKIVPELDYLSDGYSVEVGGVEEVAGEMCYKVVVKNESGKTSTHFFSKDSGLKLKSIESTEQQGQTFTSIQEYSDYRDVDGIKFPHVVKVSGNATPMPMEFKVNNIEVNPKFDPSVFN